MAECYSYTGFATSLTELGQKRTTYEQFKGLMAKWNRSAMVGAGVARVCECTRACV